VLKRWWSQKYGLPATHELYTSQTEAALTLEWLEDLHRRREELRADIEARHGDFNKNVETLDAINAILDGRKADETTPDGARVTGDPLVDEWERALAEGRPVDLEKDLPKKAPKPSKAVLAALAKKPEVSRG
jgi:hypothetical protein